MLRTAIRRSRFFEIGASVVRLSFPRRLVAGGAPEWRESPLSAAGMA